MLRHKDRENGTILELAAESGQFATVLKCLEQNLEGEEVRSATFPWIDCVNMLITGYRDAVEGCQKGVLTKPCKVDRALVPSVVNLYKTVSYRRRLSKLLHNPSEFCVSQTTVPKLVAAD